MPIKKYLLDAETGDLEREIVGWGESAFRAKQIEEWVYRKKKDSFEDFSSLPQFLRDRLEKRFYLRALTIEKKEASRHDGTVRYNFRTRDGFLISTVLLPKKGRFSVCLSTQVGCPVACAFCATGKMKFRRNLSRGEILEQILQVGKDSGRKINGVLFMGMGEPLLNYENVASAVRSIVSFRQFGIGRRHVTVSTVGILPMMRKLADEQPGVRLALSLHAADDATRRRVIPEKVHYSVGDIFEAGLYYARRNKTPLTIEYNLIRGLNDTLQSVQKLATLIISTTTPKDEVRVNLIPCNPVKGETWERPSEDAAQRFKNYLAKHGILAMVREAKGADIGAACGQLGT